VDACRSFAEIAVSTRFGDLTPNAVDAAKRGVLDTLGVALAATGLAVDEARPIVETVREWGGAPESTTLGYGDRLPATSAALVFGALSHLLDYDDIVDSAVFHPSAPVVATALPLAERLSGISGEQLIVAVALGQDIGVRLNQAMTHHPPHYGWLPSINGIFGSALTASVLLGLTADQTVSALGLALHQAGGSRQCGSGMGSSFRGIRDGFNARNGLTCALLAKRGTRGDEDAFEGKYGLFSQYFGGEYDHDVLLDGLGTAFRGELVGQKPWPSCRFSHLFLAPLAQLVADHDLAPADVVRITAVSNDDLLESQCVPVEGRTRPRHSIDAKTSLPFQIGKMVVKRDLVLEDFDERGLRDDAAIDVARRVEWRVQPFPGMQSRLGVGRIELELLDGRRLDAQTEDAPGGPRDPLPWRRLVEKFRDCASAALNVPAPTKVNAIVETIRDLELCRDVSDLVVMSSPHQDSDELRTTPEQGRRLDGRVV
jgi:2-methylcitrate dehydratase PrpD